MADMQKDTPQVGGAGTTSGETSGTPRVYEFPTGDEGVIRVPIHYSSLTMPASPTGTPSPRRGRLWSHRAASATIPTRLKRVRLVSLESI